MPNGNRAEQGRKAEPTAPIYVHKHSSYDRSTQIPNATVQNERLSWAARGLLAYMLSLPVDWRLNETDLVGRSPMGRDHLRSTLRELEGAGYLHRSRLRDRTGRVVQSIWRVWDLPQTDLPPTENPSVGKTRSSTGVSPQTENPSVAEPPTENPSVAKPLSTTDSVSARQQTAFPSTENPSVYKETIQQKKHLNQQPSKNPYPETTEAMGTRAEGTNPRALGTNPRALGTNPRAQGTNPKATTVNPQTADLPESLQCYRQQIADFWAAKRSGSAKTPAAFKLLVSNLLRIQADDPSAVGQQLDKATQGGFRSITHENWLKYDRPALQVGNGSGGGYRTARERNEERLDQFVDFVYANDPLYANHPRNQTRTTTETIDWEAMPRA